MKFKKIKKVNCCYMYNNNIVRSFIFKKKYKLDFIDL